MEYREITEDLKRTICNDYFQGGKSLNYLHAKYAVKYADLRAIIEEQGSVRQRRVRDNMTYRLVAEDFLAGLTDTQFLANKYNIAKSTVHNILKWYGLKPVGRKPLYDKDIIAQMYKEGKTHQEIADAIGCSRQYVTAVLGRNLPSK